MQKLYNSSLRLKQKNSWYSNHMIRQRIPYINNTVSEKMAASRRNSVTFTKLHRPLISLMWRVLERLKNILESMETKSFNIL